ncbi:hypothetical protein PPACK8108_LOCUS1017 [Phakopsora pachyrhizi]|uniref:Uncharacterized protein n=1 Tax=Phakopsora pachyrhizi TaxID=170000 RepID=A0AAV0AEW8_PHAPC|nr:hypothetical protein PPACK8108_LOCUS1017 [Phakopsora pachyrhizi]
MERKVLRELKHNRTNKFNKDLRGLKMDDLSCQAENKLSRLSNSRSIMLGGFRTMINLEVKDNYEEVEDYPYHMTMLWLAILQSPSDFNSADSDEINLTMMKAYRVTINVAGSMVAVIMIGEEREEGGISKCCGGCSWIELKSRPWWRKLGVEGVYFKLSTEKTRVWIGLTAGAIGGHGPGHTLRMGVMEEAKKLMCSSKGQRCAL